MPEINARVSRNAQLIRLVGGGEAAAAAGGGLGGRVRHLLDSLTLRLRFRVQGVGDAAGGLRSLGRRLLDSLTLRLR